MNFIYVDYCKLKKRIICLLTLPIKLKIQFQCQQRKINFSNFATKGMS